MAQCWGEKQSLVKKGWSHPICVSVCPVQGAADRCVLERLAGIKWGEVPAAGGLPGQPETWDGCAAGASGCPLHWGVTLFPKLQLDTCVWSSFIIIIPIEKIKSWKLHHSNVSLRGKSRDEGEAWCWTSTGSAAVLHHNLNQLFCSFPGDIHQSCHWAAIQTPETEEDIPERKRQEHFFMLFCIMFLHSLVNLHNVNNYANNIFSLFFSVHAGKDFLRAAQMNMNFATWGRLMMSILPPCSSLEPLSPPLPGTNAGAVSSTACQSR